MKLQGWIILFLGLSNACNYYKSIRRPPKRSPHLKTDMGADGILLVGQRWFTAVSVGGRAAVWSKVSVFPPSWYPFGDWPCRFLVFFFLFSIFYRFKIKYFQHSRGYFFPFGNTLPGRFRPGFWFSCMDGGRTPPMG